MFFKSLYLTLYSKFEEYLPEYFEEYLPEYDNLMSFTIGIQHSVIIYYIKNINLKTDLYLHIFPTILTYISIYLRLSNYWDNYCLAIRLWPSKQHISFFPLPFIDGMILGFTFAFIRRYNQKI